MSTRTTTSAVRLTAAALAQYLSAQSSLRDSPTGEDRRRVVLLRSVPEWDGPAEVALGEDRRARIAAAPSVLAVHEQVLDHLDGTGDPRVLVVLTDREEPELDPAILARVHKKRIDTVDNWDLVRDAFGAEMVDPALKQDEWAAEALLEAAPLGGWPRLPGGPLSRRAALTALAIRRLNLGRHADRPGGQDDHLDPHTLLRWSLSAGAPDRLLGLREAERRGLARFLAEPEQAGYTGEILAALTEAGHGADAVPFGLVCAALWDRDAPESGTSRARGRAEQWLGSTPPASGEALDERLAAFGRSCLEYVRALLAAGHGDGETAREARRLADPVLERSGHLVRRFGAESAAAVSPILPDGLDARFTAVGDALADGTAGTVAEAVAELGDHLLAADPDVRVRVERTRMAQRLTQWVAGAPAAGPDTVAAAVQHHIDDTGWADRALDHIEAGGDPDPRLKAAYDRLGERVRQARRTADHSFAQTLAVWTETGSDPGSMLTVETFLERVARPVATAKRRVLLLLLDGMSAAIAAELAEELRRHWAEYDPLPENPDAPPRRRGMAAALPTLTAVSRTSLFAGALTRGTQADEKRLFAEHRFRRRFRAAAFHKDELRGQSPGDTFGPGLSEALADEETHVAVVLNTIDDRLAKEQKLGDGAWRIAEIGKLRELLRTAAAQGMAVVITGDHGHVVDRHGTKVDAADAASARHRIPAGPSEPLSDSEVHLHGRRVVDPEPGGRIVALWDTDSRYTAQKAGYHGGASLAEVAIPVLAFLPFGAEPPKGWRELGDQHPRWWHLEPAPAAEEPPAAVSEAEPAPRRTRTSSRKAEPAPGEAPLFDLPEEPQQPAPAEPVEAQEPLADRLLATETFQAQVGLLARKPPMDKVESAIRLLVDNPTLPATALAQRVGYPQSRADGFAAVLRQLLNYDGIQVLQTLPDGRTLRLNLPLLRDQFELDTRPR